MSEPSSSKLDAFGNEKKRRNAALRQCSPEELRGTKPVANPTVIRASQIGLMCVHFLCPESVAGMTTSPMEIARSV